MAVKHILVISDTHFGSTLSISKRHRLDDGGFYDLSGLQKKLSFLWQDFWKWAYHEINGEPFVLVHNGDIIDGQNKMRTSALSSLNLTVQARLAIDMLEPHIKKAKAYYQIRGTEAHAGISAQDEEAIASVLGAEKDEHGNHARWELWMKFGKELIHFAHHISSTVSTAYESSAPMREMVAAFTESGQHGLRPPSLLVRSHRHRFIKITAPGGQIVTTPSWQCKTPYVHRMDRLRAPQFGGLLLQLDKEGKIQIIEKLYFIKENKAVQI